ncbi:hypothetical protein L6164_017229 [Bauhinia variegata]|uniref:Uncharacterized protein n=1 Tax=Bauhinia variegata TaxID=167791 RepID=A0ACB9N735_BAUVA|nr:hypothetical protein L6164_017229 [Bauhinia variegata]
MENSNNLYNLGKPAHTGRPLRLPPKGVTSSFDTSQAECFSHSVVGSEGLSVFPEGLGRHQRTLSADFLQTEEVPSWLTELLDEPDTSTCRSHRRCSSDSLAFLQSAAEASQRKDAYMKHTTSKSSSRQSNFYRPTDLSQISHRHPNSFDTSMNASWELSLSSLPCSSGYGSTSRGNVFPSSCAPQEPDVTQSETIGKQNTEDPEVSSKENHGSRANPSASKAEAKRAKRLSAQQSRARRLKYIAELERSIQVLQQEGCEVSAELEFLDQQNLILGMENRNLKQRLDNLSQERFIKCLEQEMLEKEIARLRNLHQQKQLIQAQPQPHKHYWSQSCDLGPSFSKLSLKNKEPEMQRNR